MKIVAAILDLTLKMTFKFCFDERNGFVTPQNILDEVLHISVTQFIVLFWFSIVFMEAILTFEKTG